MSYRQRFSLAVFLRTHFSDNHEHKTGTFNFVRDYLKASTGTKSYTAAKATLTRLLTVAFDTSGGEYCTFSMTMASGLSRNGSNIDFEKGAKDENFALFKAGDDEDELRTKLCVLMHIIFTKMKQHNFMIREEGTNVYRVFHCSIMTTSDIKPLVYALFSFLLQVCLTAYVIWQMIINFEKDIYLKDGIPQHLPNLPLALFTVMYSAILAYPGIQEMPDAFDIFGRRIGMLQMMDLIVNGILPTVLFGCGFFVIWGQESFIDAVLNTAALLFIPDIDDQLPSLLGVSESSIIKNFLISESMKEFDALHSGNEVERRTMMEKFVRDAREVGMGVQFSDNYITNWPEQASSPADGNLFQPFQVSKGKTMASGHQIDPSYDVTDKCLIKKISWKYTIYGASSNTSKPRVGYLRLEMLAGYTVDYERPHEENIKLGEEHSLEGVYLITCFQMSNDILRLRVCGSKTAEDFMKAFDYYALFPLSSSAKGLLSKHITKSNKGRMQGQDAV